MNTEQKFNCIFCKDVFDNKEELQVHFRKHADPQFKSKNRFGCDTQVADEKCKEKSEMVSCDVCTRMFPTISKAITHKHKVHPDHDVKYFCPWCGKLFTMKHPYNNHIQNAHGTQEQTEKRIFHCDCCEVDFYLPSAMKYHNKFFHQQDTDIPDVGMSKKLKLYNQESLPIFYCAFCGEEYENKVNLFKHLTDDHSDENQIPDEVLRCPLCEAIFYHLDAYEIHLSFHTTEDLYSQHNDLFESLVDFSLESVPPVIERVENRDELEAEAQSHDKDEGLNINAVGIEKFLELAMDQNEDSNPGKVKKKKHKKSKKAAITLDEFLSMNQDVFGEDLDFQGVEELPTRVVKKRTKNNKKSVNSGASAELEKLKQKGIVVMKVGASKPTKAATKKISANRELKTSSEVLTKLINQSNNQIKIVKKSVPKVNKSDVAKTREDVTDAENEIKPNDDFAENRLVEEAEHSVKQEKIPLNSNNSMPPTKDEESSLNPSSSETLSGVDTNINTDLTNTLLRTESGANRKIPEKSICTSNQNSAIDTTNTSNANVNLEKKLKPMHDISPTLQEHDKFSEPSNPANNDNINERESDFEESDSEMIDRDNIIDGDDIEGTGNEHINERNEANIKPLANSLTSLKHLSHLTVKPVNQNNTSSDLTVQKGSGTKSIDKSPLKFDKEQTLTETEIITTKQKSVTDKDSTLDTLKTLSKNITIKSLPSSALRSVDQSDADEEVDEIETKNTSNVKLKDFSGNKNITIKKIKVEPNEPVTTNKVITMSNTATNIQSLKPINKVTTISKESGMNKEDATRSPSKANILKHLPNITTTSVPFKKFVQPQVVKQTTTSVNTIKTSHKEQEIIEISDIDDSDNESDYQQPEPKQDTKIAVGALKNLSKHITVKSLNQPTQSVPQTIKIEKAEEQTDEEDFDDHEFDEDDVPYIPKVSSQKLATKNVALKNALKNLGKNITVKSGTSSPCQSNKSQDHFPQHSNVVVNEPDDDEDSDSDIGKVKITELEDGNVSNNDSYEENSDEGKGNNEPIIESPHDSCSEDDEVDHDPVDFESKINTSKVLKVQQETPINKNALCLNNLKNISNNLTIKSLSANSTDKQEQFNSNLNQESAVLTNNQNVTALTMKPTKPVKETSNEDTFRSKTIQKSSNVVDQTSNESMNQKVSVNKEVTVKTFQTKTVIQEITTTVTKTIKTVNQSMKQETRNSNQMCIPVIPQKVQGMRSTMSKNLQGVVIRQAAPVRSNNVNQTRPAANIVRPKQVTPARPSMNVRPSAPRMPNAKKSNLPISSPNQHVIGKPLKFSPTAMIPTAAKRPTSEDTTGPFSCFKKPKESLIPVSEVPTFTGGGETIVQMKAASQTSNNYMSTSKIVKGNSIVTATQTNSEVSSTMQQLSRLGTVSVKVKSAQVKQNQVHQTKTCSKERTTLEAIEKLQKQGLLVKKPRIELSENSDFEELDDNVGLDYSSEQDE